MLATLLIVISVVDLLRHRIPHWSLALLILFTALEDSTAFNLPGALVAAGIGVVALSFTDVGAGDVKLFFLLVLLVIPKGELLRYFSGICISAFALLLIHAIASRGLSGRIAFAPALCGGVLSTSVY